MKHKRQKQKLWEVPPGMDKECVDICKSINNKLIGIFTIESCCGHGDRPYRIFFGVRDLDVLPILLFWMRHFADDCHTSTWHVEVYTDCAGDHSTFMLEGPVGKQGYEESKLIAKALEKYE